MTSSIDTTDIDGAYPTAARDNDSQGFRDNFTNIKDALQHAKEDIDEIHERTFSRTTIPSSPVGDEGDYEGHTVADSDFLYVCIGDYDGTTSIWYRVGLSAWS